jgi:nitrate reductase alpha subunit
MMRQYGAAVPTWRDRRAGSTDVPESAGWWGSVYGHRNW